jgi:hypothetical protein
VAGIELCIRVVYHRKGRESSNATTQQGQVNTVNDSIVPPVESLCVMLDLTHQGPWRSAAGCTLIYGPPFSNVLAPSMRYL